MAVGEQPSEGGINATLTQLALALRDLADNILEQYAFLNKLGASGLQGVGFTPSDSGQVLQLIDYMGTVMQVYKGNTNQPDPFNFEDALTILWAGS